MLDQIFVAQLSMQNQLATMVTQIQRDVNALPNENMLKAYLHQELSTLSPDLAIQWKQFKQWQHWLQQAPAFLSLVTIPTDFYDPNGVLQDLNDEWRMKPWLLKRADQYIGSLLTTATAKAAGAFAAGVVGGPAVGIAASTTATVTNVLSELSSLFKDVQFGVNAGAAFQEEYVLEASTAKLILAYRVAAQRMSESKVELSDHQKQLLLMPWSRLRELYDQTVQARRLSDVQSMVESLTGVEARLSKIMAVTANGINVALEGRSSLVNELGRAGEKLYAYSEADFAIKHVARDLLIEATLQRWSPQEFAMAVAFKLTGITDASLAVKDLFRAIRDDVVTPVAEVAVPATTTIAKWLLKEEWALALYD
jgi:hypothetical protein